MPKVHEYPGRPKLRVGFAAMSPETQRAIASKGGKSSHALGTGHEWNKETASAAGKKRANGKRNAKGRFE